MELTQKQLDRVKKTIEVVEKGNLAVTKHIFQLEEYVDQKVEEIKAQIPDLNQVLNSVRGKDGVDGQQGIKGDKPVLGVDYEAPKDGVNGMNGKDGKTPTKKELVAIITPLIPEPISGLDGLNGKDGINGKDGKDGSPDTAEQIVSKINDLPEDSDFKIDASHIKNLPKAQVVRVPGGNGTQPVKAGNGITITKDGNGAPVINVTAVAAGYQQPTSGAVGQGVFTWAVAPNIIVVDGRTLQRVQTDGTENWTIVGTTTTLVQWPQYDIFALN